SVVISIELEFIGLHVSMGPMKITGKKVPGDGRGKGLGFPTLNLSVEEKERPEEGIYAVKVSFDGRDFKGAMHVGPRPTFEGTSATVEIHVLDFNEEVAEGTLVEFEVVKKLREVLKFDSVEELVKQIQLDVEQAKDIMSAL
ncbi:MAG: riboflavin kinase, partial [Patescibacteria group bacterium]